MDEKVAEKEETVVPSLVQGVSPARSWSSTVLDHVVQGGRTMHYELLEAGSAVD